MARRLLRGGAFELTRARKETSATNAFATRCSEMPHDTCPCRLHHQHLQLPSFPHHHPTCRLHLHGSRQSLPLRPLPLLDSPHSSHG
jgi:hypothetical protein